jgi:predicted aminopeptidase
MRRAARVLARLVLVILLLTIGFLALTPMGRYIARAAWEEGRILARRKSIEELVRSPSADPLTRAKLQLVLDARAFAVDSVGLAAGESFTTYSQLTTDTLVLVLAGAYRDELKPYTWWFPVVGRVPYKGFFDPADARHAARDLEDRGIDVYLRPASAFSTLGWFNDPLLSTTLDLDSASLANTVIHELTHNTFYAPGQAIFNESFANFVGAHGAMWFFRARGDSVNARASEDDWERDRIMGRFWESLYRSLDSAFSAHANDRSARLAAATAIYDRAAERYADRVAPRLPGYGSRPVVRPELDNAILLARRVYRTGLDDFDAVFALEGHDLKLAMQRIIELAKSRPDDPYGAVREWLAVRRSGSESKPQASLSTGAGRGPATLAVAAPSRPISKPNSSRKARTTSRRASASDGAFAPSSRSTDVMTTPGMPHGTIRSK